MSTRKHVLIIVVLALFLRVINFSFPFFTQEEARIGYRGYALAISGKDELGRSFPLVFNSLTDYQMPLVSYIAAFGELVFGKSEFGVRMPFILIGSFLAVLIFYISKIFCDKFSFRIISALIIVFSPLFIFISKTPNQSIVLSFLFCLLFYLLAGRKALNMYLILIVMILLVLTSKFSWFILTPFVLFVSVFYHYKFGLKNRLLIISISLAVSVLAFALFINIEQGKRSLSENNFSVFSDVQILNDITRLKGQGLQSGWPPVLARLFFNKSDFLIVGLLHWFDNVQPGLYFSQFDNTGVFGDNRTSAFGKILIIPAILGLIYILSKDEGKHKLLIPVFFILTFPSVFIFPDFSKELTILTVPFLTIIAAFGFLAVNNKIRIIIFAVFVLESLTYFLYLDKEQKNASNIRPVWVEAIIKDVNTSADNNQTLISDNIVDDIVPYLQWYGEKTDENKLDIPWPYKFRVNNIGSIKLLGSDVKFTTCNSLYHNKVFVSNRDLEKIKIDKQYKITKVYSNGSEGMAYLILDNICI